MMNVRCVIERRSGPQIGSNNGLYRKTTSLLSTCRAQDCYVLSLVGFATLRSAEVASFASGMTIDTTHSCPICTARSRLLIACMSACVVLYTGLSRCRLCLQTGNIKSVDVSRCHCTTTIAVETSGGSSVASCSYEHRYCALLFSVSRRFGSGQHARRISGRGDTIVALCATSQPSRLHRRCLEPPSVGRSRNLRMATAPPKPSSFSYPTTTPDRHAAQSVVFQLLWPSHGRPTFDSCSS